MPSPVPPKTVQQIDRTIVDLIRQRLLLTGNPTAEPEIDAIMRHIQGVCNVARGGRRVCYLGPEFSYSHLAALKYFGDAANLDPVSSISAVFDEVQRSTGQSDPDAGCSVVGIVPIENSTDGRVVDTLGRLMRCSIGICGEVLLPIHHCLLSLSQKADIQEIHSKPQALSQCRQWLSRHLPAARWVENNSTAGSAELARNNPHVAAIASVQAGRHYGLNVVAADIEDNPNNVTRFAVLGRDLPAATGADKTSLVLQVLHQPGALADVMATFKNHRLNLTWIESFPMADRPSEYFFVIELDGHRDDAPVAVALDELRRQCQQLQILGSYPRAV